MSSPPIAILLPFYNAEKTLPDCLDSILAQTQTHFELIAIDDGSQDGSATIVQQKFTGDSRLHLLQPGRIGLVAALNLGLQATQAPLIARMDADDKMMPQRLDKQHQMLKKNPQLDLIACQVKVFPEKEISTGFARYIRWQNHCLTPKDIRNEIYWESPLAHPTVMFRRQSIIDLGGYRDGPFPEDYDLWLRMVSKGFQLQKLSEILVHWRESDQRLTWIDPRYSRTAFDLLRAKYLAEDPRIKHNDRSIVIWGAGRRTRRRVKHLLQKGIQIKAWIDIDPKKMGQTLQGVPVHDPEWLIQQKNRPFVLIYILSHGAREKISPYLHQHRFICGQDYLMVG
ncbi:glycosyltransferase [Magnetococcales bacterium HHB-1]